MVAFLLMFGVFGPLFILPKGKQHGSFSISLFTQLYGLNYPAIHCKWVEYENLPKELNQVHAGYIYFDIRNINKKYALPNKFFSFLNNGIPVVVNRAMDMKNIIEKHQCGIVIDKDDPTAEEYVEQFLRLYKDRKMLARMSKNAREAMKNHYCWEKMEERLAAIYKGLK